MKLDIATLLGLLVPVMSLPVTPLNNGTSPGVFDANVAIVAKINAFNSHLLGPGPVLPWNMRKISSSRFHHPHVPSDKPYTWAHIGNFSDKTEAAKKSQQVFVGQTGGNAPIWSTGNLNVSKANRAESKAANTSNVWGSTRLHA